MLALARREPENFSPSKALPQRRKRTVIRPEDRKPDPLVTVEDHDGALFA